MKRKVVRGVARRDGREKGRKGTTQLGRTSARLVGEVVVLGSLRTRESASGLVSRI